MITWKEHYWNTVPVARARIEDVVRRAKGRVLEVGCNEGFLTQALKEKGLEVVSVDNNDECIQKAKDMFDIDVIKADANVLPFADESFDLVVGGEILEHLANPGKGLSEMFRVSKGWVIITIPIGAYWLGEETHKWQIESTSVEHDQGILTKIDKQALVIEFIRRRK